MKAPAPTRLFCQATGRPEALASLMKRTAIGEMVHAEDLAERIRRGAFRHEFDWTGTFDPTAFLSISAAMDVVGNPSSVHTEGRAAKAIVEKARGQVAQLVALPPDLLTLPDATARARRLLETACELELEPGVVVQWFAIRLEPPGER